MRTFYFVSEKPIKSLTPRIPHNFLTENGYEDGETPRICVSTSIDKCLTALSYSLEGKYFYVYTIQTDNWIKPTIDQVPDVNITDEHWVLKTIDPKLHSKIKVTTTVDLNKPLVYRYGDNNTAELCKWNYIVIKIYN